eukprot:15485632-Alexandrium_andersonii.AAC.1
MRMPLSIPSCSKLEERAFRNIPWKQPFGARTTNVSWHQHFECSLQTTDVLVLPKQAPFGVEPVARAPGQLLGVGVRQVEGQA